MVNGAPIDQYNFRPPAATINASLEYELEQARIYAGMSMAEFDDLPGDPIWINPVHGRRSKAHILVLYRMSQHVPAVGTDAAARKMEQDSRMRGRR